MKTFKYQKDFFLSTVLTLRLVMLHAYRPAHGRTIEYFFLPGITTEKFQRQIYLHGTCAFIHSYEMFFIPFKKIERRQNGTS
jgi:hypothetical protein